MAQELSVAYVVVMFPCYSETFILREIVELRKHGVKVTILSLRGFTERIVHEEVRPLWKHTVYAPGCFSAAVVRANALFMLRKPGTCLSTLGLFFTRFALRPVELIKHLAVFLKAGYFASLLQARGVRHLHAHFANYPASAAFLISRLTGIPFTITAHAHDIFQSMRLLPEKIAASQRLFTISRFNREFILAHAPSIPPEKVEVLHCGLDPANFPARQPADAGGKPVILSVGRMVAIKGFETLIEACALLRAEGMEFRCRIVGEGPERGTIASLVATHELREIVRLEGEVTGEHVAELLGGATLFVLPSRPAGKRSGGMDGIPVSLMEAMAVGVPVVSCRVSGIPELVEDGVTGVLVPPGDAPALAEAIRTLLGDEGLRKHFGRAGREKIIREFHIGQTVDRLAAEFRGVK